MAGLEARHSCSTPRSVEQYRELAAAFLGAGIGEHAPAVFDDGVLRITADRHRVRLAGEAAR